MSDRLDAARANRPVVAIFEDEDENLLTYRIVIDGLVINLDVKLDGTKEFYTYDMKTE